MRKKTNDYVDEICDNIETMLKDANKKDKWQAGVELCQFVATLATEELNFDNASDEMLSPIRLLEEAKSKLLDIIDREFLDAVGEMCVESARKEKEGTAS